MTPQRNARSKGMEQWLPSTPTEIVKPVYNNGAMLCSEAFSRNFCNPMRIMSGTTFWYIFCRNV